MSEADALKLPSNWTLTPVGDLLKFKNGLNKGKAFFGYGTPIVNYMDVFTHAGLRRSDVHGLVDVTNAEKKAFSARKGDILFTRTSETPEEVGVSTVILEDIEDAVFSGFVLRGRPINERLSPAFAQYCFASRLVRDQIISSATYTTRALTNGRILSGVLLPLPNDPNEQQAIAAALTDADGVVAGLERVIAKKRLIKQGAMQDLLTARRRLPGFSGEWEVKRLGDICRLDMGGTPSRRNSAFWGKGHPWLTIADMQSKVIYTSKEQITEEGAALLTPVKTGTLIMSFKLSIGRLAFAGVDLFTNEAICSFNDLEDDPDFLYYALTTTDFALYGKQAVKGYTLNKQSLKDVEVFMPERKEQQAIAAVLSDMDAEIQTLEARLTKARAVKEGMMQNLLTGRVRLV
jgi:type I restriction enzyme, S subunit